MEKSLLPIGRRSFQKWLAASLLATQCAPLRGMDRAASGSFDGAVEAVNNFAFQMMRELGRDHSGKNLFFSPLSIEIALMMAAEGARGETALEIGKAFPFHKVGGRPKVICLEHGHHAARNASSFRWLCLSRYTGDPSGSQEHRLLAKTA